MTLVILNAGERLVLDYLVNRGTPEDLVLRLFANDVTAGLTAAQVEALTEAAFTEATFTGYSAVTLTGASWSSGEGDPATAAFAQQTFTSGADQPPQTIWGYYYTRVTSGEAVAFEELPSPVTVQFVDERILVTPRITAQDTQD